jgi:hypothetical protein
MIWILAGVALATAILLGALAWRLKRRGGTHRLEAAEDAMQAAEQSLAGFVALSAAVGHDGQAALVFGEGLRVAVLKVHGTGTAAREIAWRDVRATHEGLFVATGDRRFGAVLIAGIDNLDVRRLAPQLTRG